jgi:hypothetical protein
MCRDSDDRRHLPRRRGPARAEGEVIEIATEMSAPPRCYLDTCIISGIAREQLVPAEQTAVLELLRWHKQGRVSLLTSDVTRQEISQIPEHLRFQHEALYSLLADVPSSVPLTALSPAGIPMASRHGFTLQALERLLPDRRDARHVLAAQRSRLDYFVTTDNKTILRYRDELQRTFGVTAVLPSELVAALSESIPNPS